MKLSFRSHFVTKIACEHPYKEPVQELQFSLLSWDAAGIQHPPFLAHTLHHFSIFSLHTEGLKNGI